MRLATLCSAGFVALALVTAGIAAAQTNSGPWVATGTADGYDKSAAERFAFSNGDFVSHASERKRAQDVTSEPFAIPKGMSIMLSEANLNSGSSFKDASRLEERLILSAGKDRGVWAGAHFVQHLIQTGQIANYPDVRTESGMKRFATEQGGLLLVEWQDGLGQGSTWFELRVTNVATGHEVFRARHTIRNSVSWRRWNGISDNEIVNPAFNSFIDWYRANSAGVTP